MPALRPGRSLIAAGGPRTSSNFEDGKQLIRASGSVGANYIEANDALSKKDFLVHLKISGRETKESRFFLRLMTPETERDWSRIAADWSRKRPSWLTF